ncbi:MAG: helix-turn-helix transcriptional regulator, partial [Bacteroidota bacterium]|nr:helix-turn-helix transcriptional regulator [Bacteroidota bacterium]
RIRLFLDKENKSSSKFAEEVNVQPSGVSHILSGRNKPSLDFIIKMLKTYPYLNTDWLLFGKGEMYTDKEPGLDFSEEKEFETGNLFDDTIAGKDDKASDYEEAESNDIDTGVNKPFSERIIIFYPDGTYSEYNRRK